MSRISIIVPVYNAEKELPECLDSIVGQKEADFELLLIDDGSKDGSWNVVQEYAKKDPRIKTYHQENQGITATRRTAVNMTSGDYIWFIDDDDIITPGSIARLTAVLDEKKPDVLWFGYSVNFMEENYSFVCTLPERTYEHTLEAVHNFFATDSFNMYWNKLYKADMLRNHDEFFPIGKDQSGDLIFNCEVFSRAGKVTVCPDVIYQYQKRSKETMVNRFLPDSEKILNDKEEGVRKMLESLGAGNDSLINDYLLREYEVFVINLFAENCPYSRKEKIRMIRNNITTPKARSVIAQAKPVNIYSKIFRTCAGTGNAGLICSTYAALSTAKNRFSGIYQAFRKLSYKGKGS
ncbi:MAG: glycosyltransferase [Solobacterium sp.]|nr:glycosyltransferase [Solobacterium sp.]